MCTFFHALTINDSGNELSLNELVCPLCDRLVLTLTEFVYI